MITSKLILSILDLLLDGDAKGILAKQQIPFLTEEDKYEYTGSGFFVGFYHREEIWQYRLPDDKIFNGVFIRSPELTAEAEAMVHMKDGIVDYLEVWSFDGNYPQKELDTYELRQVWKGSPSKVIKVL